MATRTPGIGQQLFPEMPEAPFAPVNPDAQNALARALTPAYVGLHPERYQDITPELVKAVSAESLRPSLIGVARTSSGAVGYPSAETRGMFYVTATAREYGFLSGSVEMLGQRAVKHAEDSLGYQQRSAADPDKAKRAGIHAVEGRMAAMQRLGEELVGKIAVIDRFAKAAEHPGFAHLIGDEAEMRTQFTYLIDLIVADLLGAVSNQRDLTADETALNRRAFEASIFIDRPGNQHITNFKAITALFKEWERHKLVVIASRQYQSRRYIRSVPLRDGR